MSVVGHFHLSWRAIAHDCLLEKERWEDCVRFALFMLVYLNLFYRGIGWDADMTFVLWEDDGW